MLKGNLLVFFMIGAMVLPTKASAQEPRTKTQTSPFDVVDPNLEKVDVQALIHLKTIADVARVRKELIAFIWKNEGTLPTASAVVVKEVALPKALAQSGATCATLQIPMDKGFSSLVHHIRPQKSPQHLALFHHGHAHDVWSSGGGETVQFFLQRGYEVLVFQMPLMGDNRGLSPLEFRSHNDMAKLATKDFDPIRFFLEPVVVSLNHLLQRSQPQEITMIGLSGGGWTTTLCAAVDVRIQKSFPVAGTLPLYLRTMSRDLGDWEQFHPDLYKIANYLDLYLLGSTGEGRHQRQILNQYDSCCFAGVGFRTYENRLRSTVATLGPGHFDVFLDSSHRDHLISRHALEKAVRPLIESAPKGNR